MNLNDLLRYSDILLIISSNLHPYDLDSLSKTTRTIRKSIDKNKKCIIKRGYSEKNSTRYKETKFNGMLTSFNDKPSCIYSLYPLNQTIIECDWKDKSIILELVKNIKTPNIFTVGFHVGNINRRKEGPALISFAGREIHLLYSVDGINFTREIYRLR